MATPSDRQEGGEQPQQAASEAREHARIRHQEETLAFYLRRRLYQTVSVAPATTLASIIDRVVLQKDFANVVMSPTAGSVECEIVFDGDSIRIYCKP